MALETNTFNAALSRILVILARKKRGSVARRRKNPKNVPRKNLNAAKMNAAVKIVAAGIRSLMLRTYWTSKITVALFPLSIK